MAGMLFCGKPRLRVVDRERTKKGEASEVKGTELQQFQSTQRKMATIAVAASLGNWDSLPPSTSTSTPSPRHRRARVVYLKPLRCAPIQQQVDAAATIMCEPCNGKGWLLCDFCKGQKTNIKADNKRIYRRCPSCRAVGYVLCSRCKVFKCVTFPNFNDTEIS